MLKALVLDAMRKGLVSIKGPLTTPVGGGIRSLNVALRQKLDLYACVRPVRWYDGTPSPMKAPGDVDMIIFRENSEDVYDALTLVKELNDDVDYLIKRYSKCISKSTPNFLEWLTDEYKKRLRTYIRINFDEVKNLVH